MTAMGFDYMPLNRQLFRRSLADALNDLLRQKYGSAKAVARNVAIDPSTAENLRKGHLSVPTLEKALLAEGRALWNQLGDELFGETFYQFEERRIESALKEAESVRSNLVRLRAQSEELLAGAGLDNIASLGSAPPAFRREEGRSWAEADEAGRDQTTTDGPLPAKVTAPKRGAR